MLSKRDIEREIGNNINVFPLNYQNIKENSINLTVGQNGWTTGAATVYWYGEMHFSLESSDEQFKLKHSFVVNKGSNCVYLVDKNTVSPISHQNGNGRRVLLLLPHTTTIVETEEVIGIGNRIGGAVHSKVGVVAKGIGHIGTMLGPGYCGHLMISLHNITDKIIILNVGSTFISISFDYLKTQVSRSSTTVSGHVDKFAELGIDIDENTRNYLTLDWKSNIDGVREKMVSSEEYKSFSEYRKRNKWREMKKCLNRKNIVAVLVTVAIFFVLHTIAAYVDKRTGSNVWTERFWNVGCSGLLCTGLFKLLNLLQSP